MTEYLLTVHGSEEDFGDIDEATMQQMFADVEAYNERARQAGIWVFAGGLQPASTATVVDASAGEPVVTDGPYLESKEHIGGFWIFDLPDLDAALSWAKDASKACQGKVEVRPFQAEPEA